MGMNTAERPAHVLFLMDILRGIGVNDGGPQGLAGTENILLKIIRLMPPNRYRFSLATFSMDDALPLLDQLPCPLHIFPLKTTYDWNAVRMASKLRRLIRSQNVNIVHTFFESSDIWGGLVAKLSGCPILISSRRDMGYFRSTRHRFGYRLVNQLVDQVHTVSEQVRISVISRDGIDPRKVVTVYNGVELDKLVAGNGLDHLRLKFGLEMDSQVITTVANIRPVKGIDVLIRAAAIVCKEFPRARFLIVGAVINREYYDQVQELVRALHLAENVVFVGRSDKVPSLLKLSTLFCLLSRSEGFSNAILEAMATGLPCVVTKVGGNPEAIEDGQSGFLVPSEDCRTAADRILTLLQHPERAKQIGQAAREIVNKKFTADAMVDRWATLYDDLLARRNN